MPNSFFRTNSAPSARWVALTHTNNNVVVRVVMRIVMRVMLVDNHGWFVSDDDFIGTYHWSGIPL
jgi:hypothetical protein